MTIYRLRLCIPLFFREIALRILLIAVTALFTIDIQGLAWPWFITPALVWFIWACLPLLIILHHILRLWPRRRWLVLCEVVTSLVEVVTVGYFYIPETHEDVTYIIPHDTGASTSLDLLRAGLHLAILASSIISCLFLFCDILSNRGKNILHRYDFSAGLRGPGQEWCFIFGRFTARKRFSTDNRFIRCIRGGVAILSLLGISCLVFYAFIWQPVQWSDRPGAKIFKVSLNKNSDLYNVIDQKLWEIGASFPFQAILPLSELSPSNQRSTMNMTVTYFEPSSERVINNDMNFMPCDCGQTQEAVWARCSVFYPASDLEPTPEILLTINFSGVQSDSARVYLGLSPQTDSINDILTAVEPIGIGPGLNLHGWSSFSVKERFSDQKAAAIGIPKYRQVVAINLRGLSPDWSPTPRDNNIATLRITTRVQQDIEIEQEYLEGSVLNNLATVGGVWTLVNGVFAAVFGSTLLLVLFGIKPLSIYGLIHFFRPGRGSLVDSNYVLSPEERDHIVGILKEHLLDVDDVERDRTSSSHNSPGDAGTHV